MEQLIVKQISSCLWYIGIPDEELRQFHRHAYTDCGVTYSTYLLDTGDGKMLIGTPPVKYATKWITKVLELTDWKTLKWLTVFGRESDRTAVKMLLDIVPELTIVAGTNALFQLKNFMNRQFDYIEIRSKKTLDFGKHICEFHILADLTETKSLYVIDQTSRVMYTADVFGSLVATEEACISQMRERNRFMNGIRNYYTDIIWDKRILTIKKAISLAADCKVDVICPAYGPVWDQGLGNIFNTLMNECNVEKTEKCSLQLAIIYDGTSYTRELATQIEMGAQEITEHEKKIEVFLVNLEEENRTDALQKIRMADFYLFGVGEENGDVTKKIWDIVSSMGKKDCKQKKAAVFGCGKRDGVFLESFLNRLEWLGFDLTTGKYIIQEIPGETELKNAYEYGFDLSCILRKVANPRKPKLVKCLVCGEIFEASLGICPVCGVGLEQCVPVTQDEAEYHGDSNKRYLIIGGGIAAVSAAEAIRMRDKTGSIDLITAERYLPINRPMLTKDFKLMKENPEGLFIHDAEWYERQNISVYIGTRATKLDLKEKSVTAVLEGQREHTFCYDKLIYATGAECFVPLFKGVDKKGIITIRHLEDSKALEEQIGKTKHAVVIGGGVLGLEAASELMRQGLSVTVFEATPQIIGRQIDAVSAELLREKMKKMKVECFEGVSIEEIIGEKEVEGVRLSDGRIFPAGVVIVSCGNRGNIKIASDAGITVERSIVVDAHMMTNDKDVFACGDCAQYEGMNFQLWQEASEQGKIAGANAAGEPLCYRLQVMGLSMEGFATSLFALGDPGKKEGISYKKVRVEDEVEKSSRIYWFQGGTLVGAVVIGKPDKTTDIMQWISTRARHCDIVESL